MHTLTQEQADEVVRILGFDGQAEDSAFIALIPAWVYYLEDGTVVEIGEDCRVQHQMLIEVPDEGLVPRDMGDVAGILGPNVGVVELKRNGRTMGLLDWFNVDEATPEQRHIHDLRILDITSRTM